VDARELAAKISQDLQSGSVSTGAPGYPALPAAVREAAIDFAQWRLLDRAELYRAAPNRCRRKVRSIEEMLVVCRQIPFAAEEQV
jgi:ferredoxin/flavodoxin---NADP+ reductase